MEGAAASSIAPHVVARGITEGAGVVVMPAVNGDVAASSESIHASTMLRST